MKQAKDAETAAAKQIRDVAEARRRYLEGSGVSPASAERPRYLPNGAPSWDPSMLCEGAMARCEVCEERSMSEKT